MIMNKLDNFSLEINAKLFDDKNVNLNTSGTYVDRDIEIDIKPVITKVYTSNELDDYLIEENADRIFEYNGDDTNKYKNGNWYIWKEPNCLCFTANEPNSTIALNKNGSPSWTGSYSLDGQTWTEYAPGTTEAITLVNTGDRVYFKGTYTAANSSSRYLQFAMTGSISASGSIMSLCSGDKYKTAKTIPYSFMFWELFYGCTSLTTAPELPATKLTDGCYGSMFGGCILLTTAPELPATTLANNCYQNMFYGCTSLAIAPELPATTLAWYCYNSMFRGCTSLTIAPELPATTLANNCYQYMFRECSSLAIAPELPATTLANSCYYSMFQNCTSLTTVPELPATTLKGSCYDNMFSGCILLTTVPQLPATTLADYCYNGMFRGCTSLAIAPELPATTLAAGCYQHMFNGCTKIKLSKTQEGEYTIPYRIPKAGTGTDATVALNGMFTNTGGTWKSTLTINTTYYLSNTNSVV